MQLTALHGFLGRPDDWTTLFSGHPRASHLVAEDLFSEEIQTMPDWAEEFNCKDRSPEPRALMGYSLGGRLALHALVNQPQRWQAAVIISAHLGLSGNDAKEHRYRLDDHWAERFENDAWDRIMEDWNGQGVFKQDTFNFKREESYYCRNKLASSLRQWSLAKQEEMLDRVCSLDIPILWIAGSNDHTYANQATKLQLKHPLSNIWIAPETGHRVPWQRSEEFLSKVDNFLTGRNSI